MTTSSWRRSAFALTLLCGGVLIGGAMTLSNVARGEVRATPQPQAFQTGGQLAVPVLKEIAATLHQIDARLARLEAAAQKIGGGRASNLESSAER